MSKFSDYIDILEFIERRFKKDCDWLDGNCYYMSIILKNRFPSGTIYYDVIMGHFLFEQSGKYYDFNGEVSVYNEDIEHLVKWDEFQNYDQLQKLVIEQDCIL